MILVSDRKKGWNSAGLQKKIMPERIRVYDTGEEGGGSRHSFAR